jgi:hypothetical protein
LTLQTFAILDASNLSKEAADKIKVVYMHALMKTLLRGGEIAMRYQSEFVKEMEACQRRPPSAIVTVLSIMRLEEECRNFLPSLARRLQHARFPAWSSNHQSRVSTNF